MITATTRAAVTRIVLAANQSATASTRAPSAATSSRLICHAKAATTGDPRAPGTHPNSENARPPSVITNAIPSATAAAMGGMSGEPSLRFCSTGGIAWI